MDKPCPYERFVIHLAQNNKSPLSAILRKGAFFALFLNAGDFRQFVEADLQIFVGRNVVAHCAVHKRGVSGHVEIAGAGKAKQNRLGFAGFLAFLQI